MTDNDDAEDLLVRAVVQGTRHVLRVPILFCHCQISIQHSSFQSSTFNHHRHR